MGNTGSSSTVEHITKQITDIATNIVQNCQVLSEQSQVVDLSNTGWQIGGTSRIKQSTDISQKCFSDLSKQADLQTQISNAIKNATNAQGVAVLPLLGNTIASASARVDNLIKTNVTMSNIQNTYTNIKQTQNINASNIGMQFAHDVDITQGAQVFAMATLKAVERTGLLTEIDNKADQTASAVTKTPLDFLADIFGSISNNVMYAFIFIAVLAFIFLAVGAYMVFN